MSEPVSAPVSALAGATFQGFATIREAGPVGMLSIRGNFASQGFGKALKSVFKPGLPKDRRIATEGDRSLAWMSSDELLLILPYGEVPETLATLTKALAGEHALAVDVSDARALFTVTGPQAREVLAKLCPVDLDPKVFGAGEMRRTRAAQVAAAIWMDEAGVFSLVCFRSVAGYVMGLLTAAAAPGGEVGLW